MMIERDKDILTLADMVVEGLSDEIGAAAASASDREGSLRWAYVRAVEVRDRLKSMNTANGRTTT